ncbi:glycosyltransferase family 2 protein [Thermithiobacillus plumbiphilus]|uniref:Glycosyltransferase family 2 protein n=1 Tax=Thermithiobacillus plumbiphilus TaxID=1729899 RepID=A0ABU9D9V5_9PROT
MKISVLVPTYRRPDDLSRCLRALAGQHRVPDEVLVVLREDDHECRRVAAESARQGLPLRQVTVHQAGQVAALNSGLMEVSGDVVAITDDDAAPWPDWLLRIEAHFLADPELGGVGGRDWVYHSGILEEGACVEVGRVLWYGRAIGNHHIGAGAAREVDVLKGANFAFRTEILRLTGFDTRLRGNGAQVCNEMGVCLAIKRAGWRLIYDPAVAVDHFPAKRHDIDQRASFNFQAQSNMVHNETLVLLDHLPFWRKPVFLLWALLIGTSEAYGLAQVLRFLPRKGGIVMARFVASFHGRYEGVRTWLRT